jgi:hypothetical protein
MIYLGYLSQSSSSTICLLKTCIIPPEALVMRINKQVVRIYPAEYSWVYIKTLTQKGCEQLKTTKNGKRSPKKKHCRLIEASLHLLIH